jgi:vancomycin permeability regulator SanA
MNSKVSDIALDLGVFALDSEIETGEILGTFHFTLFSQDFFNPASCLEAAHFMVGTT